MSKWELPKDTQFYKWESPIIEIFKQTEENYHKQLKDKLEEQLMCEVNYQVGCAVDKNELIKALNYDREQYDKGYKDGVREAFNAELEELKSELEKLEYDDFDCNLVLPAWKVYDIIDNYIAELKGGSK